MSVKVIHITQASYGGIYTYLNLLLRYKKNPEIQYSVICPSTYGPLYDFAKEMNVEVFPVEMSREIDILNDIRSMKKIRIIVKKIKPNVVHIHSSKAGVLARPLTTMMNIPTIYTPHGFAYRQETGFKKKFYWIIEKSLNYFTDLYLTNSASEKKVCIDELGLKKEKVISFTNSIELPNSDSISAGDNVNGASEKYILMVGRLTYAKNPQMFIKAAAIVIEEYKDVKFKIVGAGLHDDQKDEIDDLIKQFSLNKNFEIIGWKNNDELNHLIKKSLFVVMPSRTESFGYIAAEAGALGKAVIVTNVIGLVDIVVPDKTGIIVENENYEELAQNMIELLNDPQKANQIGEQAFFHIQKNFDIKTNIKIIENIYLSYFDKYN